MIKNVCDVERVLVENSLCTDAFLPSKKSGRETSLSLIFPQGREASVHRLANDCHLNQLINYVQNFSFFRDAMYFLYFHFYYFAEAWMKGKSAQ